MQDDEAFDRDQVDDPSGEVYDGEAGDWREEGWPQRVAPAVALATFVLGVVTSLVIVLTWAAFTDEDDGGRGTAAGAGPVSSDDRLDPGFLDPGSLDTGAGDATLRPSTRLSRCVSAARTLEKTLGAAGPALDQWAVHVGAMNQLVVGEITLQQATAFWDRTRLGAQRRIEGFREAMGTLRSRGLDCPSPDLLAPGARALPGCARQVEAEARALGAARTSIDTWEHHVHQMDMLRLGEITPEEATEAWLSMWQQGVTDLDSYRAASREARRFDGCGRVGQAG